MLRAGFYQINLTLRTNYKYFQLSNHELLNHEIFNHELFNPKAHRNFSIVILSRGLKSSWLKSILIWKPVHHQIPLLLTKSDMSFWMYPIAQTTLSPTLSHPWVPPEWPYCQQAQCGRWFTVKHSKAGLQTSSHPQNSAFPWITGPTTKAM